MLHGNLNFLFRLLFFSVDDLNFVTALLITQRGQLIELAYFHFRCYQNHLRSLLTEA